MAVSRKKCLRACAKYAESHDPAHAQGFIRAFGLHSYILWYPVILLAESEAAQADLGLRFPHMLKDTFSHGLAHIFI